MEGNGNTEGYRYREPKMVYHKRLTTVDYNYTTDFMSESSSISLSP